MASAVIDYTRHLLNSLIQEFNLQAHQQSKTNIQLNSANNYKPQCVVWHKITTKGRLFQAQVNFQVSKPE